MRPDRCRGSRTVAVPMLTAALLTAACGTSLTHDEIVSSHRGELGIGQQGSEATGGAGTAGSGALTGTVTGQASTGTTAGGSTSAGATGGVGGTGATGSAASGGSSGAGAGTGSGTTTRGPAAGAPIVVASVGTLSGIVGEAIKGVTEGARAWVGHINAAGGLAGHPVQMYVADDRGDSSRHFQLVQEMVEEKKAIAFLGNSEATSLSQQTVDYLARKKVPTIGDEGSNAFGYATPYMIPPITAGRYYPISLFEGAALLAKRERLLKIGLITCVEAAACQQAYDHFEENSRRAGLTPVYKTQTSITTPDFTAQCLQAQRAGTEVLHIGMDFNSVRRVISSCMQQGWHPRFVIPQASDGVEHRREFQGSYIGFAAFSPWATQTPAQREYRAALKRTFPGLAYSLEQPIGWLAGKLFEKAVLQAKVGSGRVTNLDVMRGLNSLRNETLGGLTGPLNFPRGKPATPIMCFFSTLVGKGKWEFPVGTAPSCKPLPR